MQESVDLFCRGVNPLGGLGCLVLSATTGHQTPIRLCYGSPQLRVTGARWKLSHVPLPRFRPWFVVTFLSPSLHFTSNPIVSGTLKIWAQIRRHSGWLTLPQTTPFAIVIYSCLLKLTLDISPSIGMASAAWEMCTQAAYLQVLNDCTRPLSWLAQIS